MHAAFPLEQFRTYPKQTHNLYPYAAKFIKTLQKTVRTKSACKKLQKIITQHLSQPMHALSTFRQEATIDSDRLTERLERLKGLLQSTESKEQDYNKENIIAVSNWEIPERISKSPYATFGRNEKGPLLEPYLKGLDSNVDSVNVLVTHRRNRYCGKIIKNNGILQPPLKRIEKSEIARWREKVDKEKLRKAKLKQQSCTFVSNHPSSLKEELKRLKKELMNEKKRQTELLSKKTALQREIIEMSILSQLPYLLMSFANLLCKRCIIKIVYKLLKEFIQ
eukprot:TRINITY_DN1679_c0_g1_i1.p1 TRINITY_DN1679_c0_g1~~TRINITY_DN1679_c0_g1_i1.p1  ORF type:complete len:279 (+),score=18.58 TRINITY_DN1679_c0_g1_i1:860-1696(+)